MSEHCRFQEVREGRIYCKILDRKSNDYYEGDTKYGKLCSDCPVPENPCRALSVRTQFSNDLGRIGVFVVAVCQMKKKKKIKLPEDCLNCPDYTF